MIDVALGQQGELIGQMHKLTSKSTEVSVGYCRLLTNAGARQRSHVPVCIVYTIMGLSSGTKSHPETIRVLTQCSSWELIPIPGLITGN